MHSPEFILNAGNKNSLFLHLRSACSLKTVIYVIQKMEKTLLKRTAAAFRERRRLVAPLMGFPGLQIVNSTIKLAQQNFGEHYKVLRSLVSRFQPDMIFPMMDLSVEANALGLYTVFPKYDTPTVIKDQFNIGDLERHRQIDITCDTRLQGYVETMKLMRLSFPEEVIKGAYVTGPYTLASLIMGADEAAVTALLEPEHLAGVCEFTMERTMEYARLLTGAGAQAISILEPTAVMLGPEEFESFSSRYILDLVHSYKYTDVSIIYHTCGNTMHLIDLMAGSRVDAISLDAAKVGVDLPEVARRVGDKTIIIGNIDPTGVILTGTPEEVKDEVSELLHSMDFCPNFILSTGCDLPQEVPFDNIAAFMTAGRQYRIGK